jgi:hypothetical protein
MPEIMIFKSGKYPQGDFGKERMQKLVDIYDPEKNIEAPVVIGHHRYSDTDEGQFAHGWVKSLRMDGAGKIYADIPEFSAEAKRAIAENKLRYISAEIFEFDKIDAGQSPYLRAVALLGRDTPAVPTARLPSLFSLMVGGDVAVNDENHTAVFTRKMSKDDMALFEGKGIMQNEEGDMGKIEDLEKELASSREQIAAFQKERDELVSAGRKTDAAAFFGKLRDGGKLAPALFERAVALDARLDDAARKDFRSFMGEQEAIADLSGAHAADKKKAPARGDTPLSAKIKAFQTEHGLASFSEAADALYAENPALFEEGEL